MKTCMQIEKMIINCRYKAKCEGDDVLIRFVLTRNNIKCSETFISISSLLHNIVLPKIIPCPPYVVEVTSRCRVLGTDGMRSFEDMRSLNVCNMHCFTIEKKVLSE